MASAAGIRAGRAYVELATKDDALQSGLKQAQAWLASFAKGAALIGGGLIGAGASLYAPLLAFAKVAANMSGEISKASIRTGIAVEQLSGLKFAAESTGSSLDEFVGSIVKMQRGLAKAKDGKADPFGAIGLNAKQLIDLKPDEAFLSIADALSKIQNPSERNAAAMSIFGRGVSGLLPLLAKGRDGIGAFVKEAEGMGLIMSTSDVNSVKQFNGQLGRISKEIKQITYNLGVPVAQAVTPFLIAMKTLLGAADRFVAKYRGVGLVIAGTGVVLSLAGTALLGLAGIVTGASLVIAGVPVVIGLVGTALAALVSPAALAVASIGVVGFAIAGGVADFLLFTKAGQDLTKSFGVAFREAKEIVTATVGGMSDALSAGDLGLAGQIAMAGVRVAFTEGKLALVNLWMGAMKAIVDATIDTFYTVEKLIFSAMGKIGSLPGLKNTQNGMAWQFIAAHPEIFIDQPKNGMEGTVDTAFKAASDHDTADLKKQIDELKGQLFALRDKAHQENWSDGRTLHGSGPTGKNGKGRIDPKPPQIPDMSKLDLKSTSIGGFSADDIGRQSRIGSVWDKIADATRETAKNTAELAKTKSDGDDDDDTHYGT